MSRNLICPTRRDECSGFLIGQVGRGGLIGQERVDVRALSVGIVV